MIILGIDPGTIRMGYAILKTESYQPLKVLNIGYFNLSDITEQAEKLKIIYEELQHIIQKYKPDVLSIEAPFYGKNVQSMLKLGRAQGIAMAVAFENNLLIQEYSPKKIKQSITGNGNASKEQVYGILHQLLKFDYTEKFLDGTDALAAAVCYCFQQNKTIKIQSSTYKKNNKKNSWKAYLEKNPDRKI